MNLNAILIEILNTLKGYPGVEITDSIVRIGDVATLTKESITIADAIDAKSKIVQREEQGSFDIEPLRNFVKQSGSKILRINHVGISYSCENIPDEIRFYRKALKNSPWKIYKEDSESDTQWLFIGDTSEWQKPLFEIVLTESPITLINEWTPHFQIDIDTTLTNAEIKKITDTTFGKNFSGWELNINNHGVVLIMGLIGTCGSTKIYLGIGTNLRDTEGHRKEDLKELKD